MKGNCKLKLIGIKTANLPDKKLPSKSSLCIKKNDEMLKYALELGKF